MIWTALRKELLAQWRSYRLLIVVAVLAAFGMASPLLAKFTPEFVRLLPNGEEMLSLIPPPTVADAVTQYTKNISQFGVVLALLVTMGVVAQEKDRGTAALILVKPISRRTFLGAKFVAIALSFLVGLVVAGLGAYYYTLVLFEALDPLRWLALNGLMWLFLLVYVALTLFCSTLSRSQVVAGGLAFALLVLVTGLGAIPRVGDYVPNHLISWGSALVAGRAGTAWPALGVSLGMIAVALVGSWLVFRRQEL